ncbi:hypothetical protein [Chryseobacterium gambrini]|uniref:hypothetical protein n=1 Tax=Chryseobacterium gambrini TaxID=373672 RepID=UPI0022F1CD61|nr:hypothetical protein [Chryseobacterium gambrini]WBV50842.1 hypothetical protein PFY09_10860 [Chryseobacterium gambrini]
MFSKEQEQEITDYLMLHKLPLDILLEVKDHMISQVADIQTEENLNFQNAFHKTQKLWESEFKRTTYSAFFSEEIPVIVKKIVKERYFSIFKKSLLLGLVSAAVNFASVFLMKDAETYSLFFQIQNGLFILFPVAIWALHYKMLKYIKSDYKYKGKLYYTMYQQNAAVTISMIGIMGQIVSKEGNYPYLYFREHNHDEIVYVLITLILPFIVQVMIIFVMINFFEHKKSLEKMKEFLNLSAE